MRTHESPTEVSRCGVVRDWMTHRPVTVPEDCPIGAALGHMRAAGVRHLVVTDGDRVTGIVSNRCHAGPH